MPGETELLWRAPEGGNSDGWNAQTAVRIRVTHRPKLSLMTVKVWQGATLVAESGDITDQGQDSLKGGRVGIYSESQEKVTWSAMRLYTDRCTN